MNRKHNFVLEHIRKHSFTFAGVLAVGLLNNCVSFLLPVSIGEFFVIQFNESVTKGKLLAWLGIHLNSLYEFYIFFIVLLILRILFGFIESIGNYRLAELFVKDLREKAFYAQIFWPSALFSKNLYGKYLLRYSNDMKAIQNYFLNGIIASIKNLLFIFTGLFLLSMIHLNLTLVLGAILLLGSIIIYVIARYQRPFIKKARSCRSSLLAFVAKTFSNFKEIKQHGREKEFLRNFNGRSEDLYHANTRSNKVESLLQNIVPFMIFLMIGIFLWQMTFFYGRISTVDGLMMILIILMMQGAFRRLLKVPGYLNKGNISMQKIDKLLQDPAV